FLGVQAAAGEIVCFFDDDIKILDQNLFLDIQSTYMNQEVVGVSAGIKYESGVSINRGQRSKNVIRTGKISWLGRTTGLPNNDAIVDYFPGPIMSFRKEIALKLFDEYLFYIF